MPSTTSTHVVGAGAALVHPAIDPLWQPWSAAWTQHVQPITGRTDLNVILTPGAGQGAPACHTPEDATIEVDATHLDIDPTAVDPYDLTMRPLYAAGWGLLVHEGAHAKHTVWPELADLDTVDPAVLDAAMLLEEARMEARHLHRRDEDRQWLHAAVTQLIAADIDEHDSPHSAATAAALLLTRTATGILTDTETTAVRKAIIKVLGRKRLKKLEQVWQRALRTRDDDHAAMLEWGNRWVRIVGRQPRIVILLPGSASGGTPQAAGDIRQAIDDLIILIVGQIIDASAEAREELRRRQRLAARQTEESVRREAAATAAKVFHPRAARPRGTTRPPTDLERSAASQFTRALRAAGYREPVVTRGSSLTPPGRLNTRAAMSNDVQRQLGQTPTAEPWNIKVSRAQPRPPLRVGIVTDVSGSMDKFIKPAASTGYVISHGVSRVPNSTSAQLTFGVRVTVTARPGQTSGDVREYVLEDDTEGFVTCVDALDHVLGLSRADHAARLLVIISDGYFGYHDKAVGQARLDRLARAGCAQLWIAPANSIALTGPQLVIMHNPAVLGQVITDAALAALAARP